MKYLLKRVTSCLLVLALLFSLMPAAFAVGDDNPIIYYVANSSSGGSDRNGNGSEGSPYMTIGNALKKANEEGATSLTINLLSDIQATLELSFNQTFPVIVTSNNGGSYKIQFTGTTPIGNGSGFIKVDGAEVLFRNVTLAGSTGTFDGRVLYAANGAVVNLENVTVTDGRVNNPMNSQGGAGIYAATGGIINVKGASVITGNETTGNGGGIFVADGGTVNLSGTASVTGNEAASGGGICAETQSSENGGLFISENVTITRNTASQEGSGMYIKEKAKASVAGDVKIFDNKKASGQNNVYLAENATLDISGATTGANIGISADPEKAYRLVSNPKDYTISPTKEGDEKGWSDDCGTWDIRYMTYNGVPGLYLYHKTLDMEFQDVRTLTGITGQDINGEDVDFLTNPTPSTTNDNNGVLTVKDTAAKNGEDLTITFTVDPDEYRIPTEEVVSVTSGSKPVDFTYMPDFEAGTATITINADVVKNLTDTIQFKISGEKYYDITLRMEGPLYAMSSSITGLEDGALVISESSKTGTVATYKLTKDGKPVKDVTVELYQEGTDTLGGQGITGSDGVATITGLKDNTTYYPILKYQSTYRIISRDVVSLDLSTLEGQTLAKDYVANPADNGTVTYNSSTGKATITGMTQDGTVIFSVNQAKDTITFVRNEGDATTKPATLSMESKEMQAGAMTYGELATASLTGYDFLGWFTDPVSGEKVTSDTKYNTSTSPRTLYAHWQARTDTAYQIQHWVEYAKGGQNERYEEGVTQTKEENGKTYYLYETTSYSDGTSDAVKDISGLDLKHDNMQGEEATWWARIGFTPVFDQNCKVLADGSSVFSIYYNRNGYQLTFAKPQAGTAVSNEEIPPQAVQFGAAVGTLPQPTLPGYEFGGWYDGEQLITETSIYNKHGNTELVSRWNAKEDTKWAIKVVVQDLTRDEETDICLPATTYTELKTVFLDNDQKPLQGKTDTTITFDISSINELTIEGFDYIGYSESYSRTADSITADTSSAQVYVNPTDALTDDGKGKYNEAFDGGIVWLYYDRKTREITTEDGEGNPTLGENEIVYGGDFTGLLPEDPGKDGYDFSGWVDPDNVPITEDTLADAYVKDDNDTPLEVVPTWTARSYRLTYVPGLPSEKTTFVASDGSAGEKSPSVIGGYLDSNEVTYDKPMGTMPSASKTGYSFDGWFLEDGTQITSDTIVSVNNVVIHKDDYSYENTRVLNAKYAPHTYTFKLNPGKSPVTGTPGTVDPTTVSVTYDAEVRGLPVPKLTGYRFVGWMMDLENPASMVKNGDTWTKAYTNGAEIPLYAAYIPETYTYTFDLNDSVGSTRASLIDTTVDYVEETFDSVYDGIFAVEAARSGYVFQGWSLTRDGDILTAEDLVALAKDATVYASWQPVKYNVKFVMRGASMNLADMDPTAVYDEDADTWTIRVAFDTEYGPLPVPEKEDCEYHGWLVDAAHWDAIDNEIIQALPSYTDYLDKEGIILTAVMEPWITFDPNGAKFTDGSKDPIKRLQSDIEELPEVKPEDGYHFDGWVDKDNPGHVVSVQEIKQFEEPVVLIPKFSANITFHANGGKLRENGQETMTVPASTLTSLPSATRSGYTLDGWYSSQAGGNKYDLPALTGSQKPITVYAHWTEVTTSGGGGGGGGGVSTVVITVIEDTGAKVTPNGKVTVAVDSDQQFDISAEPGYMIIDVIVDDKSMGPLDSYEFKKVKEAHTLVVRTTSLLTGDHIAYISGYPDSTVHPNANITRAEVATIFYRLLNDDVKSNGAEEKSPFTDVTPDAWYAQAVMKLAQMGILKGYEDGSFKPAASITRAEFATVASRFDKLETGSKTFSDVPLSHWAYAAISSATEKGWVSGYEDGTFKPEKAITRAEVAKLTNAVLDRQCDKSFVDANASKLTQFKDLSKSFWGYYEIMEAANAHDYHSNGTTETWTGLSK